MDNDLFINNSKTNKKKPAKITNKQTNKNPEVFLPYCGLTDNF